MSLTKPFDFCFVISDLLATTPRAYRAIRTLLRNGHSVALLYNVRRVQALEADKELHRQLQAYPAFQAFPIDWTRPTPKVFFWKLGARLSRARPSADLPPKLLALAIDPAIEAQIREGRRIDARVWVGHRPATLPVLDALAGKRPIWFDIEDFHFQESDDALANQRLAQFIPQFRADHFTDASALIGRAYLDALGRQRQASLEILNSPWLENPFPKGSAPPPKARAGRDQPPPELRMVWFSQTITFRRGLEELVEALPALDFPWSLQLVGQLDPAFAPRLAALPAERLRLHGYIPESQILRLVAESDIGLALERPDIDRNKDLAISNKLLTYAVLGTYALATRTSGQADLLRRLPSCGALVDARPEAIAEGLRQAHAQLASLRLDRWERARQAAPLSWESQGEKLLRMARRLLVLAG